MRGGVGLCGLLVCLAAGAPAQAASEATFAPRLSDAAEAMEYWDVAAWFDSGHRFFARFLITNEGPGTHTAAAAAHLVSPDGTVTPIMYGRTRDAWLLGPNRRRLKIASAVLDLGPPLWRVEVDSDTYGFKVLLRLDQAPTPVSTAPLPGAYQVEVVPPRPARGTVWLRGMNAPQPVEGTIALTHTWMERNEAELVQRRVELFGRAGDVGIYFSDLTFADGRRRGLLIASDDQRIRYRSEDLTLTPGPPLTTAEEPRYPLPERLDAGAAGAHLAMQVRHEWLRWAPLDIVPQPFRFFLGLRAAPRLVWTDADFALRIDAAGGGDSLAADGRGLALFAFANPQSGR